MQESHMEIFGQRHTQMPMQEIIIRSITQVLFGIILIVKLNTNRNYYEDIMFKYLSGGYYDYRM
jgi:hypothetical protein